MNILTRCLDPLNFLPESLIGIPNLMEVYRSGNVGIINAPGNGVADDKGIYYFVPKMIKYYLDEEPILHNAPTYLPFYEDDMKYVLDNLEKLVIKDYKRKIRGIPQNYNRRAKKIYRTGGHRFPRFADSRQRRNGDA